MVSALLLAPRVLLRREATTPSSFLARSSLFTYLTQGITINLLRTNLGVTSELPNVAAALAVGAVSYTLWDHATGWIHMTIGSVVRAVHRGRGRASAFEPSVFR
jgi:hypothetical protein